MELLDNESILEGTKAIFERDGTPYTAGTLPLGNDRTATTGDERDTGEGVVRERPFKRTVLEDGTVFGC